MTSKFLDAETFRGLARRGDVGGARMAETTGPTIKADDGSRRVPWVLSDGSVDRSGDTISPTGWDTTAYRKNNVVLWGHDSLSPPIGRAWNVRSNGIQLVGDIEFASADVSPFADSIFRMIRAGFIRAGSVGFLPKKWKFTDDQSRPYGIDFQQQELVEFSIVAVPANSGALALAAKNMKRGAFCGRSASVACGLRNSAECVTHAWASKAVPRREAGIETTVESATRRLANRAAAKRAMLDVAEIEILFAETEDAYRRGIQRRRRAMAMPDY